jgi:hypothetical protein
MDKLLDLAEVLKIMSQNDTDSAYLWNADACTYDILTYTDLIEMIIFVYNTMRFQHNGKNRYLKI